MVTDFDATWLYVFLSVLAERHTDEEILAMLTEEKLRKALPAIRQHDKKG